MLAILLLANIFILVESKSVNKTTTPVNPDDKTNGLVRNGKNVCTYKETITKKVNQQYMSQRFTTITYQSCNWLGKCITLTKLGTKNVVSTRVVTKYVDRDVYYCCNGWKRENDNKTECATPVCIYTCQNGGRCSGPNTCQCKDGFSGTFCQLDNDECKDPKINNCQQLCINSKGGFKCACNNGYTLQNDKKSCLDIDECAGNNKCGCQYNDGVCKSTCTNTDGSYNCQCSKGYYKNSAELCEDINECHLDQTLCDHKCVNTPGGYNCRCFAGFRYDNVTKKCIDIDECATGNGGCSDSCINTAGNFVCSCPSGKYLDSDAKTCKVIDLSTKSATFCTSGPIGMLSCDNLNEKINVTSVFYGRVDDKLCQSGDFMSNLNCVSPNAKDELKQCDGTTSCLVMTDFWHDPCPGIEKYATVSYRCMST